MAHRVLVGPSAVRGAGFPVRALEDLSLDEQRLETSDELEQGTFGWILAERLEKEPSRERLSTWTVWDLVAEIAETDLVEAMG